MCNNYNSRIYSRMYCKPKTAYECMGLFSAPRTSAWANLPPVFIHLVYAQFSRNAFIIFYKRKAFFQRMKSTVFEIIYKTVNSCLSKNCLVAVTYQSITFNNIGYKSVFNKNSRTFLNPCYSESFEH